NAATLFLTALNAHPQQQRDRPERTGKHRQPRAVDPACARLDEGNCDSDPALGAHRALEPGSDGETAALRGTACGNARPVSRRGRPGGDPDRGVIADALSPSRGEMEKHQV